MPMTFARTVCDMADPRTKDDEDLPRLEPDATATAAAGEPVIVDSGGIRLPEVLARRTLGRFVWRRTGRGGFRLKEI
jgi:hypothetical protein